MIFFEGLNCCLTFLGVHRNLKAIIPYLILTEMMKYLQKDTEKNTTKSLIT
jgi:ABC-type glucose/galactose transport system permease subunit